jgi:hypothetical protein
MKGKVIAWLSVRFRHGETVVDSVRLSNSHAVAVSDKSWGDRVRPADTFIVVPLVIPQPRTHRKGAKR